MYLKKTYAFFTPLSVEQKSRVPQSQALDTSTETEGTGTEEEVLPLDKADMERKIREHGGIVMGNLSQREISKAEKMGKIRLISSRALETVKVIVLASWNLQWSFYATFSSFVHSVGMYIKFSPDFCVSKQNRNSEYKPLYLTL